MDEIIISLSQVSKTYLEPVPNQVLHGIDLNIERGEFCSLVGASGSGKSTLLNILGTLDIASSGDVEIGGVDINSLDEKQLAYFRNQTIGFIFQFHFLLPQFTVLENVLIPHLIYQGRVDQAVQKRAEELLERVGISHRRDNRANAISGGEQQRVAVARALINRPRLVLADEPTGNLDSNSGSKVFNMLRDINREYHTTFIIVTHDRDLSAQTDRFIELKDGVVLRDLACK